jgi:hypothetical protein
LQSSQSPHARPPRNNVTKYLRPIHRSKPDIALAILPHSKQAKIHRNRMGNHNAMPTLP